MYNTGVEMTAIRAVVDQEGCPRSAIQGAVCGYPELTSAVTAVFHVKVKMKDGNSYYEVPVAVRVDYTHPVALGP